MTRQQRIQACLLETLTPILLEVQNESNYHQVPVNSETHFKVTVVSDKFENTSRVMRHRWINDLLATELKSGLHALSLHLYTPAEWDTKQGQVPNSPACKNRDK
jgi:BolA protein